MVKTPLRKVLGNALLSYIELSTLCKEIEGQLNDRLLVNTSEDTSEVLTPSLLCLGRKIRPWVDHFEDYRVPGHVGCQAKVVLQKEGPGAIQESVATGVLNTTPEPS